ncbi:thioredoxin [Acidihalobacter prosperus]|uniref:Thioredoxin n=1 Tax=Acidihalobacter prosperus TaxID=160660 RepID=A0A1A6C789_9GAMM|nr:thioredoxin [Acidihalobacter prosperus]OBS10431.1 thiol reductase thioredoxin [Acidihalobacter prosperus]
MSDSPYVFDVTAADFAERVLQRSQQVPVLVDFWADWCGPCRMLAPVLDGIANSYGGKLLVAKVNSDAEQALASQYGIRSLPTVKLFVGGAVVDEFMGVQPESVIRELLERHVPRESDGLRAQARAEAEAGHADAALALLRRAREDDPDNHRIDLDLAELLIAQGQAAEAEQLLRALPAKYAEDETVKRLLATSQLAAQQADAPPLDELREHVAAQPDDLAAREQLAAACILAGEYEAGMDAYLEIMRRSRSYNDDAGRRGLLAAFELLSGDDRVTPYRRKMFNLMH